MFKTTIAGLRHRKLRVLSSSFAVLLGVAFMAGSLVLTDTIGKTFDTMFADIYAGTDAYVRGTSSISGEMGDDSRSRLPQSMISEVGSVEGVALAEGVIQGYTQIVGSNGKAIGNPGMGAPTFGGNWSDTDELNPFIVAEGRAPRAADEVVIDKKSATDGKLAVGDRTTVLVKTGAEPMTVVGIATFGELDSPGGASFALFTDETSQRIITAPGEYNGISILAEDGVSQTQVQEAIAPTLPDTAEVITGAQLTEENQSDLQSGLSFFNIFLGFFAVVALFVGSFIIYNTFSILVAQRSWETALLRAVGASRRQVLGSILLEALVVGMVASVLGIVAGLGMALLLQALLNGFGVDLPTGSLVLTANTVVTCTVIGIGVSVVSAVFPARRAAKVAPVEAMRAVAIEPSQSSRARAIVGLLLTLAGAALIANGLFGDVRNEVGWVGPGVPLTFIGVAVLGPILARPVTRLLGAPLPAVKGMTGVLARNNAIRNPKRTSATAAALMIGVGLVGFITVFASSAKAAFEDIIDDSFGADLVIDSGSFGFGGLPPSLADEIDALPESGSVGSIRFGTVEVDGSSRGVSAVDAVPMSEMFDLGLVSGSFADLGETQVALHEDVAESKGLSIGSVLPVTFVQTGEQPFTVAAIYSSGEIAGDIVFGLPAWEANVADQFDVQVYVLGADGVSMAALRSAVDEAAAPYPTAKVQDLSEFKEAQSAQINQLLGLIYALLGLAVLIAVLGIANTLALSIFERTRELGLLRAVGMTRAQLRSAVRWESVLIALFGTGLGLVIGIAFGSSMVLAVADEGVTAVVVPPGQMALIAGLAALCGVLAAVLPARRAARLDVLGAIATA